jgi:hypothetical protein
VRVLVRQRLLRLQLEQLNVNAIAAMRVGFVIFVFLFSVLSATKHHNISTLRQQQRLITPALTRCSGSAKVVSNRPTVSTAAIGPTDAIVKIPNPVRTKEKC